MYFQAKQLSLSGGHSTNEITRRIMTKLLNSETAHKFSRTGKRTEKRAFNKTKLYTIGLKAAQLSMLYFTDREYDSGLSLYFKHIKDSVVPRVHKTNV